MPLFGRPKYTIVRVAKKDMPSGVWTKCEGCAQPIYIKTLNESSRVCPKCHYHFTITAKERINLLIDKGSFKEMDSDIRAADPLQFKGPKHYKDKLKEDQVKTKLKEAIITGEG